MEFIKSKRNTSLLKYQGHVYRRQRKTIKQIIHWRCCLYHEKNCFALLHTNESVLLKGPSEHNHTTLASLQIMKRLIGGNKTDSDQANQDDNSHQTVSKQSKKLWSQAIQDIFVSYYDY